MATKNSIVMWWKDIGIPILAVVFIVIWILVVGLRGSENRMDWNSPGGYDTLFQVSGISLIALTLMQVIINQIKEEGI